MTSRGAIAFLYVLICLIWGSTWLAIKIGLDGVPPFLAAGVRFAAASAVIFGLARAAKSKFRFDENGRVALLSCGLLSFTYGYAATYWAEQYIPSGLTAILWCTMPLCTALLSRFWTRSEELTPRKLLGIGVGMAGTAALFWTGKALSGRERVAMLVALSGVLAAAVNLVTVKRHGKTTDVLALNACGMAIGAAGQFALSLLFDSYAALSWRPTNVMAVVYLALIGTVVTFLSYYHLLKQMDATKLSLITLVFPIIALLLGSRFGGERVTQGDALAIAAVLGGVAIALAPGRSPAANLAPRP